MPLSKKEKVRRQRGMLKKQAGTRHLLTKKNAHTTRRERANALPGNGTNRIANPVTRNRSQATVNRNVGSLGEARSAPTKKIDTKIDFATGRVLFPVEKNGKTQYVPLESEASVQEKRIGAFVSEESIRQEPVNTLVEGSDSVPDLTHDRQLFATENLDGKKEYLPSERDATPLELANGKFIPDNQLANPSIALGLLDSAVNKEKLKLRYDFTHQRNLFAVRTTDGRDIYLPTKSKATAGELKRGLYVEDEKVSKKIDLNPAQALTNDKPRFDFFRKRIIYGAKNKEGKTIYLPKFSEATDFEKSRGLFIDGDLVEAHEAKRPKFGFQDYSAQYALRRSQQADRHFSGAKNPENPSSDDSGIIPTNALDGTKLWDGVSPPRVSQRKQREVLKHLSASYDLTHSRLLYPAEVAKGKTQYLPLYQDATSLERLKGSYIAFVPPETLKRYIEDQSEGSDLASERFNTDMGEVDALREEALVSHLEGLPRLVLRSQSYASYLSE